MGSQCAPVGSQGRLLARLFVFCDTKCNFLGPVGFHLALQLIHKISKWTHKVSKWIPESLTWCRQKTIIRVQVHKKMTFPAAKLTFRPCGEMKKTKSVRAPKSWTWCRRKRLLARLFVFADTECNFSEFLWARCGFLEPETDRWEFNLVSVNMPPPLFCKECFAYSTFPQANYRVV